MEYLNAKQIIGRLKQGRVTDISEAYFSQLVRDGAIPNHTIPGKKRKMYVYDEVKQALANIQDPTRDAQREANAERKRENSRGQLKADKAALEEHYRNTIKIDDMTKEQLKEQTGFGGIVLDLLWNDLKEAKTVNLYLSGIVKKQKEFIATLPLNPTVIEFLEYEIQKITINEMITVDGFNQLIEDFYGEEDIAEIEREAAE